MKNETTIKFKFIPKYSEFKKLEKRSIKLQKTLAQINNLTAQAIQLRNEIEQNKEINIEIITIESKPTWIDRLLNFV